MTTYAYDPVSRLASLGHDLASPGSDVTLAMTYNPASQIATRSGAHGAYAWSGHANGTTTSTVNGLNQLVSHGGAAITHDARGNLTGDANTSYAYSSENRLISAAAPAMVSVIGRIMIFSFGFC